MIGFCPLASGSKGNSIYFGTEKTKILIDAGLSGKATIAKLAEIHVDIAEIQAILIIVIIQLTEGEVLEKNCCLIQKIIDFSINFILALQMVVVVSAQSIVITSMHLIITVTM